MAGLSIFLFMLAGILLMTALTAVYLRERSDWKQFWRRDDGSESPLMAARPDLTMVVPRPPQRASIGTSEVDVLSSTFSTTDHTQPGHRDVFQYSIRRPASAVWRTMPDLGGFSEVPLRLYDQAGNRFTVHQKVRLN